MRYDDICTTALRATHVGTHDWSGHPEVHAETRLADWSLSRVLFFSISLLAASLIILTDKQHLKPLAADERKSQKNR